LAASRADAAAARKDATAARESAEEERRESATRVKGIGVELATSRKETGTATKNGATDKERLSAELAVAETTTTTATATTTPSTSTRTLTPLVLRPISDLRNLPVNLHKNVGYCPRSGVLAGSK
ncbi:unnamed protein product, partial [Ectocarpus sp. 4 AP-2014]